MDKIVEKKLTTNKERIDYLIAFFIGYTNGSIKATIEELGEVIYEKCGITDHMQLKEEISRFKHYNSFGMEKEILTYLNFLEGDNGKDSINCYLKIKEKELLEQKVKQRRIDKAKENARFQDQEKFDPEEIKKQIGSLLKNYEYEIKEGSIQDPIQRLIQERIQEIEEERLKRIEKDKDKDKESVRLKEQEIKQKELETELKPILLTDDERVLYLEECRRLYNKKRLKAESDEFKQYIFIKSGLNNFEEVKKKIEIEVLLMESGIELSTGKVRDYDILDFDDNIGLELDECLTYMYKKASNKIINALKQLYKKYKSYDGLDTITITDEYRDKKLLNPKNIIWYGPEPRKKFGPEQKLEVLNFLEENNYQLRTDRFKAAEKRYKEGTLYLEPVKKKMKVLES